ncbi:MAG: twin-arginine translocation signal domain-containing protein [Deltaproteobacteria bacterium]|nr:twin-arginine translocation signal domain-containing protein [Deltaproteobacteria bacterium]MBW2340101.1 twin-arginine translocation signal domain-containing protein [Deltaproteobacteria bacterium]
MSEITRRGFMKTATGIGATLAVGKYADLKKFNLAALCDWAEAAPAGAQNLITVVSDVDAHSQCKMRALVKGEKVVKIQGDPTDPESKAELTLRGEHMKEILYAPDRFTLHDAQHPQTSGAISHESIGNQSRDRSKTWHQRQYRRKG